MIDPAETAAAAGIGTVLGGTLVRFLVNKWLKDREEFEKTTVTEFRAIAERTVVAKEATDKMFDMVRSESAEARDSLRKEGDAAIRVLREHVDHEDKILRDRYHAVDTLTQRLVDRITIVDDSVKKATAGLETLTGAVNAMNLTLAQVVAVSENGFSHKRSGDGS